MDGCQIVLAMGSLILCIESGAKLSLDVNRRFYETVLRSAVMNTVHSTALYSATYQISNTNTSSDSSNTKVIEEVFEEGEWKSLLKFGSFGSALGII